MFRPTPALSGAEFTDGVLVDVLPLSSVVADDSVPRLRLVKIDVDGAEFAVLRGLEPLLDASAGPDVLMERRPSLCGDEDPSILEGFCEPHRFASGPQTRSASSRPTAVRTCSSAQRMTEERVRILMTLVVRAGADIVDAPIPRRTETSCPASSRRPAPQTGA